MPVVQAVKLATSSTTTPIRPVSDHQSKVSKRIPASIFLSP